MIVLYRVDRACPPRYGQIVSHKKVLEVCWTRAKRCDLGHIAALFSWSLAGTDKVRSFKRLDLRVIERVFYGKLVQWCHRMVVTRKYDGTSRRLIKIFPINKHC